MKQMTTHILERYSKVQEQELRKTFDILDEDHDGLIPVEELIELLTQLDIDRNNQITLDMIIELLKVKEKGEDSGNKLVGFDVFVKALTAGLGDLSQIKKKTDSGSPSEDLTKIFNHYSEGKERISLQQIQKINDNLGEGYTEQEIKMILSRWLSKHTDDKGEQGYWLTFEQFRRLFTKTG